MAARGSLTKCGFENCKNYLKIKNNLAEVATWLLSTKKAKTIGMASSVICLKKLRWVIQGFLALMLFYLWNLLWTSVANFGLFHICYCYVIYWWYSMFYLFILVIFIITFHILFSFSIPANRYFCKQWRTRWNAAWCSISSGSALALFAKVKTNLHGWNAS